MSSSGPLNPKMIDGLLDVLTRQRELGPPDVSSVGGPLRSARLHVKL